MDMRDIQSPICIISGLRISTEHFERDPPFSEALNLVSHGGFHLDISCCGSLVFYLLHAWLVRNRGAGKNKPLPPGPTGFPILGSLHLLGKDVHRDLHRLAQKYGPIMYMKLGLIPTVVVSSPQAAELFLKTHDLVFASRPYVEAAQFIGYGQNNISYSKYGSYWRGARKMCTLELLSNLKINSFKSMRKQEVELLIQDIKAAARDRAGIDVSSKVASLSSDMTCLMVFGKKYEEKEFSERGFKAVIQEGMQLAVKPNLGDYIPPIAPLDLQGLRRRMKSVSKVFDSFFEKIIDEHIESKNEEKTKDFVDVMLSFMGSEESEYRLDRPQLKAIMLDMLSASSDTSSTVIEWALSELIRHPSAMKKVQEELEKVVGLDRKVEESDLESLDYLNMVVKETFRLHPVAPLLVPHMSTEDCVVNGFHIPRNSTLLVNVFAIGRDPAVWTDPEKFDPERFAGREIDVRGRDFQLIPFGSGRRSCPGRQLGLIMVSLVLAQLVHCFDWELPTGTSPADLDMTEVYSLVCPRAKHLVAIPTCRLRN